MKIVSKAALGLALALGSASLAAAPALAQKSKKGKEEAAQSGPQLKLSKEFRAAAAPVDVAYRAQNWQGVLTAATAAEAAATTPDDKYQLNQYRLQAATSLNDAAGQAAALDAILATNLLPAADVGKFRYFQAKFAYDKRDFAKAQAALDAAAAAGYASTDFHLTRARVYAGQNQFAPSLAALEQAIAAEQAAGKPVPEDWYKFGWSQAYKGKLNADFAKWTMLHLKAYPSSENWRTALVNYRDTARLGGKAELDLYRLMRASKALTGAKDHYDYAYIADQAGLPGEAKTVLDNYKTSGGAANPSIAELSKAVAAKASGDRASLDKEATKAAAAATGTLAANTANAYLGYGDYAKAVALFQTALSKGGVDADEVNTRLGIALAMQGQKDAAKAAFANVKGARAGVAGFWTAYLDSPPRTA